MKRTALWLMLLLLLVASTASAQGELSGRIEGTVYDEQAAVIPDARVTATHMATNTVYRATTSGGGRFVIPKVRLGRYTVMVEMTGFRRAVVEDVLVEIGGVADVNITLQLGALEQQVVVTSELAQQLVNTVDAELATVVDERSVLELPLDGRNAANLIFLQAGAYFELSPDGQGNKLFIHGQRHRSINITLDGIDTQDNFNRASSIMVNQPLIALAAENVQEFRVITGLSSAEFSRGGAQVTAVTRSGTNDFHGSLFWFTRNDIFSANNFFNNSATPKVDTPKLIRNQFGGRIGGPIVRDRTFFYFGYQQTRESKGISVNRLVYTAQARQGQFRFLESVGTLRTTPENVAANPGLVRSLDLVALCASIGCYSGLFNPASPFDPFITGTVFAAIPLPNNFDIGDGLNTGGFRFNASSRLVEHLPAFRLDHRFSDKHTAYTSINYIDRNIEGDFINDREPRFPALGSLGDRVTHSKSISTALTSTLSPTFINEFRAGFLIHGENAFLINQPFDTPFTLDLNTVTDVYDPSNNLESRDNDTWHIRDSVAWVRGNHQIKAGFEWRHRWVHTYSFDEVNPFGEIDLDDNDFPPGFSESQMRAAATGGSVSDIDSADTERARDLMNNLVGAISEVESRFNVTSLTSGFVPGEPERRIYQNREFDWFIQDTWAVRPNLSLTLGLRWEYATVPYETRGLALIPAGGEDAVFGVSGPDGFFNPGVLAGTPCATLGTLPLARTTMNVVNLITSCATQFIPGTSTNGVPLFDDDFNNFAPVLGLAWDPWSDGKTSIRAGFRISYVQDHFNIIDGNLDDNEGLRVDQDCIPADGACINNPLFLRDLMASGPPVAAPPPFMLPAIRSILDSSTFDFRTYVKGLATPYYEEWTLSLARELGPSTALEVRYVGNRGVKLRRVADFNEINIFAFDPVSGMTFLDSFLIAQQNLACNRAQGRGSRYDDATGEPCITANPLMAALIAGDAARLDSRSALLDALDFNEPGQFVHRLTQRDTSRPASGQSRSRGGSWWGAVLDGRFPVNFFMANPFVASARRMTNDGFSTYHALEIEVRRRMASGFQLQANYTYGKALADFDGDANTLLNDVRPSSVRNSRYNIQEFMPRHLVKVNWIYELPFGPGKPFASTSPFWGKLVEGWQTSGIVNMRSGRPISITSGVGTFHRSAISDENTVNLSQPMSDSELRDLVGRQGGFGGGGVFWLDPCLSAILGAACSDPNAIAGLFQLPAPGQLGSLSQTPIFGPRRFTLDFSLLKRTHLNERSEVEFRWDIFNVFNNVNFNVPNTDIFSPSFGQVLSIITNPRRMQFALKINF